MNEGACLVFSRSERRYGVPALAVREVVWLPDLSPVAEAPPWVLGVVDVRGRILPVIDLDVRLGLEPASLKLSDKVVLLETAAAAFGILVDEVYDVRSLSTEVRAGAAEAVRAAGLTSSLSAGVVTLDGEVVTLVDLDLLLQPGALPGTPALAAGAAEESRLPVRAERGWSAVERGVLRERAASLAQVAEPEQREGHASFAVFGLGDELFGVDLGVVREFTEVRGAASVPCCPEHIAGVMNLRGEVLTLVDVRRALGVQFPAEKRGTDVMVVQAGDLRAGVLVDQVLDILAVTRAEVCGIPAGARSHGERYLQGAAPYGEKMLGIVDLESLLQEGDLVVDERV